MKEKNSFYIIFSFDQKRSLFFAVVNIVASSYDTPNEISNRIICKTTKCRQTNNKNLQIFLQDTF